MENLNKRKTGNEPLKPCIIEKTVSVMLLTVSLWSSYDYDKQYERHALLLKPDLLNWNESFWLVCVIILGYHH